MTGLFDAMVEAALDAATVILDIYEGDIEVEVKGDQSPVTKADQAAEKIILAHLAKAAPHIPVVAEESVADGNIPELPQEADGAFFLVDPVDGTKEFINRNGEFTVNIALIRNNVPVAGVIYTPAKGWLFAGEVGKGAWRAEVADPRQCCDRINQRAICTRKQGAKLVVVGSRSHATPQTADYLTQFDVGEKKAIGSSLKFCLLAAGEADLYPRFGPTMEWDTAAGDAILTAAGGTVTTIDGERLTYGKAKDCDRPFANPFFIASTKSQ